MRACWSTRAAASVLTASLLVGTLAGCGDDEPAGPDAEPAITASSDEDSDGGSSDGSTDEPSDEPSVEPASGQQVNTPNFSLNLPDGWRGRTRLTSVAASPIGGEPDGVIVVSDLDVPGGAVSLDDLAQDAGGSDPTEPEVLDPIEVDGEMVYHAAGPDGAGSFTDRFGLSIPGTVVTFLFSFDLEVPDDERQAVVDSVLASVDWTF